MKLRARRAAKEIEMPKQASILMDAYQTEEMSDPRDGDMIDRACIEPDFFLKKILCSQQDFEARIAYYLDWERDRGDMRSFYEIMQEARECLSHSYLPI